MDSATGKRNTERNAIDELCVGVNVDHNLVKVLRHGPWPTDSGLYHIDMELCDLNLEGYLKEHWPVVSVSQPLIARMDPLQAWNIMKDITKGIAFIHSKEFVHRDIKPANGVCHCLLANLL